LIRIMNALAGVLHIPAAKLRFNAFEIKEVEEDIPELERFINAGVIKLVTEDHVPEPQTPAPSLTAPPEDFDTLNEEDAIEYIEDEKDPEVIQSILREEERPGVVDALKTRLQELDDAGK